MLALMPMTEPRTRLKARDIPAWAQALRLRRTQLGMSQEAVAAASEDGISQKAVSDLETGRIHLADMALGRVVALARALSWSLADLQRATGIDLAVVEVEEAGQEATPVFLLQDLLKDERSPDAYAFIAPNPRLKMPPTYYVVFADSNEMSSGEQRSIHKGDLVFLDPRDTTPDRNNNVYAIAHGDRVHLRRLTTLPSGPAFTADNPALALNFIPVEQARVLGRAFRVVSDQLPSSAARITH